MPFLIYKRTDFANELVAQIWKDRLQLNDGTLGEYIQIDEISPEHEGKSIVELTLIYPYKEEKGKT